MHTGHYISGAGHLVLLGWLAFGDVFAAEPLPFEMTEVAVISGAEYAAQCNRVLEHVRQHDGDPLAARQAQGVLQITGKLHGAFVELPIRHRRAHVVVRRPVRVFRECFFKHVANRAKL